MTIHPASTRRRSGVRLAVLAACTLGAVQLAVLVAAQLCSAPAAAATATEGSTTLTAVQVAGETAFPVAEAIPVHRTEMPTAAAPATAAPDFEALIQRLVTIGQRTSVLAQQDDIEAAQASDREARELLDTLLRFFHDAGERSLAMLAAMADPTVDARDPARRVVLQIVLDGELLRRRELALANDDHSRIDPLVGSLLDIMPQSIATAEIGSRLLGDRPYLRLPHENAVLGLVQLAGEHEFPRDIATRLLGTLWDNLQRSGQRSSDELSRLALLLLADADPSKRAVACRQLIADARFRPMVLAWLREHGDSTVANDIAGMAARDLPPDAALQILRELAPILPRTPGPYMVLGTRAPELVADAYRELLASNTQPDMRCDLLAGIGLTGTESGFAVVELALHNDPSPEVRIQAGFAMSAAGHSDAGERALQLLLDDPGIAQDPKRLGAIVLALQNLEAAGATNHIDRLGQRLRTLPLAPASRQQLEALLARSLPAGQVSSPGTVDSPR